MSVERRALRDSLHRLDRWLMSLSMRRFVALAALVAIAVSSVAAGVLYAVHARQDAALRRAACEVERHGLAEWQKHHSLLESPPRHSHFYDFDDDVGTPDCEEP